MRITKRIIKLITNQLYRYRYIVFWSKKHSTHPLLAYIFPIPKHFFIYLLLTHSFCHHPPFLFLFYPFFHFPFFLPFLLFPFTFSSFCSSSFSRCSLQVTYLSILPSLLPYTESSDLSPLSQWYCLPYSSSQHTKIFPYSDFSPSPLSLSWSLHPSSHSSCHLSSLLSLTSSCLLFWTSRLIPAIQSLSPCDHPAFLPPLYTCYSPLYPSSPYSP